MKPRPFQQKAIQEIRQAVRDGYKKILLVSPTGSGKTVIFSFIAHYAEQNGHRVLIGVHREKIVRQILKTLYKIGTQAGQIMSGKTLTRDLVQVGMVQTIINRLKSLKKPDIKIIDEAHHATAKTYTEIDKFFSDAIHIGVTATPLRLDNVGMGEVYDIMIQTPPIAWFVEKKLLKYPMLYGPPEEISQDFHIKRGDFDKKEQQEAFTKGNIVGNVIAHYKQYLNYKRALCFCVSKKHCDIMADIFINAGYVAVAVYSGMKKTDIDAAFKGFEAGSIHVLTSCDLIGEGVDIPQIAGVILLRRTMSLAMFLQWCGRGMRPDGLEWICYILDHAGNFDLHGHPLDEREWSLHSEKIDPRKKKPATTTKCPKCFSVWPGKIKVCPGWIGKEKCGFIFSEKPKKETRKIPKVIEGNLVEALPKGTEPGKIKYLTNCIMEMEDMSPKERRKYILNKAFLLQDRKEIAELAKAIGYKPGWTHYVWTEVLKKR